VREHLEPAACRTQRKDCHPVLWRGGGGGAAGIEACVCVRAWGSGVLGRGRHGRRGQGSTGGNRKLSARARACGWCVCG
jgi:hypothetical protein